MCTKSRVHFVKSFSVTNTKSIYNTIVRLIKVTYIAYNIPVIRIKYLEGLAASSGRLLICGDFNNNWLDTSDNICKKILNTLESYNLHQHVTNSTHKSGHLLDYIISDNQLYS